MPAEDRKYKDGWSEYASSILEKLKELHADNKETKRSIDELKLAVEKLKINADEVDNLREWKKDVCEVWSATNMEEAQKEIYIQKGKWSTVYGVILAIQVAWVLIIAYVKSNV
jgi:hypothetical protein